MVPSFRPSERDRRDGEQEDGFHSFYGTWTRKIHCVTLVLAALFIHVSTGISASTKYFEGRDYGSRQFRTIKHVLENICNP